MLTAKRFGDEGERHGAARDRAEPLIRETAGIQGVREKIRIAPQSTAAFFWIPPSGR